MPPQQERHSGAQADRNVVRDRTLILRILVPGLQTELNNKIHSIQDREDSNNASATGAPPGSSGVSLGGMGGRSSGSGAKSADQILNLDGVSCIPSSVGDTLWRFICDGATYPARLVNLPCPVEIHKTHDHATYHKSADVGQMLIVYESEQAMEEAEDEKGYKVDGFPSYYHSGLTPPMKHVVRRRFLSRFVEERERKPFPPPKSEVAKAEKEIQDLIAKFAADKGKGKQTKSKKATSSSGKEKVIEEVEEEIVDYEEWMGDGGRVFDIDDANMHPECWLTKDEIKEIEDAIKKEKQEREERAEQDAKKAAEEAAIEEAAARAAEQKKKKKKDKKKKKKHEEEEVREKDEGKREISAIDEVALTINQGDPLDDLDDDVDLGLGDMFNFDDDDGDFLTL